MSEWKLECLEGIAMDFWQKKIGFDCKYETNISYQLVFVFDRFCEILRHKTRKYMIC